MPFTSISFEDKQSVLNELRRVQEQLSQRGWFPGNSGSLSVRVGDFQPDQFYYAITSHSTSPRIDTPKDFLFVNAKGEPCETTKLQPGSDVSIHSKIYRMTGCGAILHVHTVFNNLLSEWYGEAGYLPVQGIDLIKQLAVWEGHTELHIPIVPNYAAIPLIASSLSRAIQSDIPGILLRNHGIYVWGCNAFEAKQHLEAFEFIFEVEYRRLALGVNKFVF